MKNPFQSKNQNWNETVEILNEFEDCLEHTKKYFSRWIKNVGGLDQWLSLGIIQNKNWNAWPCPVPTIETQYGNFVYDPIYQKWLDDDGLDERLNDLNDQ